MIESSSRVWEPTGTKIIDNKEVTIWASHEPTDEDKLRRKLAQKETEKRVYEMKLRIEEESRRQLEEELRRKG